MKKQILFTTEQNNPKNNTYLFNEWFEFNGKKFCYHIDIRNGWNTANQSIEIMRPDGTWTLLTTAYTIGCAEPNDYYSPKEWVGIRQRLVANFDNWIAKIYG